MFFQLMCWSARVSCLVVLVLGATVADAAERKNPAAEEATTVELFAAIESGQLEVKLIPRDSQQVTMQFANKTDKPLAIKLPGAFAALPVLAQFQPGGFPNLFPGGNNNPPGDNQGAQGLGGPFGNQNGQNQNGLNNPFGQNNGGIFNIPPGKVIKKKLPCVCLEYGKPEPDARMPYELKPLESFTGKTEVRELLESFGQGKYDQRVTQIAAWHLSNDLSWEQLAQLKIKHFNGKTEPRFSPVEIEQAMAMVKALPSQSSRKSATTAVSIGSR
jgi:hypothetical protein